MDISSTTLVNKDMDISSTTLVNKVLLIDLDNCPATEVAQLPENLELFKLIVGCSGPQEPRIPLSLAKALATPLHQGTLELVKMPRGGKNAADFGLAFMAGRLLAEMPVDTEFVILSQDSDLDHVVDLLCAANRKVERIAPAKNGTGQSSPSPQNSTDLKELACNFWHEHLQKANRPASKNGLLNHLKAVFKTLSEGQRQAVLAHLEQWEILTIAKNGQQKITYTNKKPPGY
jgi:hypothetical protein